MIRKARKASVKFSTRRAILTSEVIKLGDRSELEILADVEFVKKAVYQDSICKAFIDLAACFP